MSQNIFISSVSRPECGHGLGVGAALRPCSLFGILLFVSCLIPAGQYAKQTTKSICLLSNSRRSSGWPMPDTRLLKLIAQSIMVLGG